MNLIKRWNEYMSPKDPRLQTQANRCVRVGYYIFLIGIILCLYYMMWVDQIATANNVEMYTSASASVIPMWLLLTILLIIGVVVPLALQILLGISGKYGRTARVERIPWDFVARFGLVFGIGVGLLTCIMRMIAEIQVIGFGEVSWLGNIAMGFVFLIMGFLVGFAVMALLFREAIKRRHKLRRKREQEYMQVDQDYQDEDYRDDGYRDPMHR